MKTDRSISSILKQSRFCAPRPYCQPFSLRPFSVLAANSHRILQISQHAIPSTILRSTAFYRYPPSSIRGRQQSTAAVPSSLPDEESSSEDIPEAPQYEITLTCKPCLHRSTHRITKQGYHKGSVLVRCPSCHNLHLIADKLGFFSDKSITIEDILREKGQLIKKGHLSGQGDIELWDDGTSTARPENAAQ